MTFWSIHILKALGTNYRGVFYEGHVQPKTDISDFGRC